MDNQPWNPQEVLIRGLLRAYYWMDESLQNAMTERGLPLRTRTQTMILVNIASGITRAAELARVLGISRQAVQQHINDLEKEGLLQQLPDQSDKRANRIVFSAEGGQIIAQAMDALRTAEQELSNRIGSEAVESLRSALMTDWGPRIGEARAPGRKRAPTG